MDIKFGDLQYKGEKTNGKPNGVGEYVHKGELIGHGQFSDGSPGGVFHWANWGGSLYWGEVYHQPEGCGIMFYENGDIAAGEWHWGDLHGLSIYYCQNPLPIIGKERRLGLWEKNKLVVPADKLEAKDQTSLQEIDELLAPYITQKYRHRLTLGFGEGLGAYVSADGHLLTPTRNISWGLKRQVATEHNFHLVASDPELGLSLLKVHQNTPDFLPVRANSPGPLDNVVFRGATTRESNILYSGQIASVTLDNLSANLEIQNAALQSYEGSVITDTMGNLVSISVAARNRAERIFNTLEGFSRVTFPKTEKIYEFLNNNGVDEERNTREPEKSVLADLLKNSVVNAGSEGDILNA